MNTVALSVYMRDQDQAILDGLAVEQRQTELAEDMLANDLRLYELMCDDEAAGLDVAGQIIRARRSLELAAKGDRIALDALVACFHNMGQTLKAAAMQACEHEAIRDIEEER